METTLNKVFSYESIYVSFDALDGPWMKVLTSQENVRNFESLNFKALKFKILNFCNLQFQNSKFLNLQ